MHSCFKNAALCTLGVTLGIPRGYPGVPRGILEYPGVPGYPGVPLSNPGCLQLICNAVQPQHTPGYPRVPQGTPGAQGGRTGS